MSFRIENDSSLPIRVQVGECVTPFESRSGGRFYLVSNHEGYDAALTEVTYFEVVSGLNACGSIRRYRGQDLWQEVE